MRLTLRTLLAYMDDILEPADNQAIGKRVEESEFAHSLMSRIREVTTKLRLSAPRVSGRGMGLDPNTVAEYLDNTLPPERVPDFERVCLESDMQLAEVAGCHQILTLVLGEPVEVKPASRQRMYQLLSGVGEAPAPAHETPRAAAEVPQPAMRRKLEVPDYLRESATPRRGWWQLAAVGILVGLALGAIYMAVQPGSEAPVALVATPEAPAHPDQPAAEALPAAGTARGPAVADRPAAVGTAADTADTANPLPSEAEAPLSGPDRESTAELPEADASAAPPVEPSPAEFSDEPPPATAPPGEDAPPAELAPGGLDTPLVGEAPAAVDRAPGDTSPEVAPAPDESSVTTEDAPSSDAPAASDLATSEPPAEIEPADIRPSPAVERSGVPDLAERLSAPRQGIARYLSNQQVLLSRDSARDVWLRLVPQQVLYPGDVLLSLPTFRASVALNTGLTVELVGGTRVDLEPLDDAGTPGLVLSFGRLVLINTGKAGQRLRLTAGDARATLVFADTESTLAIEMLAERQEGTDPETIPTPWALRLYGASGKVQWLSEAAATGPTLEAPQASLLREGQWSDAGVAQKLPDWVSTERLRPIEQKASQVVQEALSGERAVELCLRELVDDRKEEVRSLAVRCLGTMDDFDPFVATLSDPHQQAYWPEQVDALRDALARGPETAALVRAAFTTSRGRAAPELYRMLWGYSDEQLKGGDAESLVGTLDHDDLAVRVVSFWNLKRISGGRTFSYRPEDPPGKRQPHVLKWRQRYEAGLLEWPTAASPRS